MEKQIKSICVDTLTGIMNEEYMASQKKPSFDQWRDWGTDVWELITYLQEKGFEIVLILGEPGTGKSTGMRNLEPGTNIWYNADNKNPVWLGGKKEYGTKQNPTKPFHVIPKTYTQIRNHIEVGFQKKMFIDNNPVAFLTGHIEDNKTADRTKQQLKTIGKLVTKMQIEGKLETVLYTRVENEGSEVRYWLETQNSGYNTCRSPQGMFEPLIENDYAFVLEKILNY